LQRRQFSRSDINRFPAPNKAGRARPPKGRGEATPRAPLGDFAAAGLRDAAYRAC
jgi:hypothetical protein